MQKECRPWRSRFPRSATTGRAAAPKWERLFPPSNARGHTCSCPTVVLLLPIRLTPFPVRWCMKISVVAVASVVGAAAVGLGMAGQMLWFAVGVAAVALIVWSAMGCAHPRPLSLLPPTVGENGARHPARWFCGVCGETWPAVIDHPKPPVPRFQGHDESRAAAAAKRAAVLDLRRRELAVRRSGAKAPAATARKRPAGPVPVETRRAG